MIIIIIMYNNDRKYTKCTWKHDALETALFVVRVWGWWQNDREPQDSLSREKYLSMDTHKAQKLDKCKFIFSEYPKLWMVIYPWYGYILGLFFFIWLKTFVILPLFFFHMAIYGYLKKNKIPEIPFICCLNMFMTHTFTFCRCPFVWLLSGWHFSCTLCFVVDAF